MKLSSMDVADLRGAKDLLENPGLAAKITKLIGSPIEHGLAMLPPGWNAAVSDATRQPVR